jgi:anti-sigma B factor antagonist
MDMNVIEGADGATHVVLDGRFDLAGAQAVDSRFTALAQQSQSLVVDLTKVSFIASLGVRTLMVSAKTLIRRGADMAVCGANENVEKVLRSTGFDEIVSLYPDFGSAAKALTTRQAMFASKRT